MIIHRRKTGPVSKSDDRLTLMLLFYIAAVCGWLWEVLVYWGTSGFDGSLTELLIFYRGVLHGPWAPIYGTGGILLVLLYRAVQAVVPVCTGWIQKLTYETRKWLCLLVSLLFFLDVIVSVYKLSVS